MGLIRFFVNKSIFVNLVAVFITLIGVFTFIHSAKEVFPQIKMGYIMISTVYPQAGPEEIEKLITIPIENAVEDIDDIKEITSWSSEGCSMIGLELEPEVKDVSSVLDDVKAAVEKISNLPNEAEEPEILEISSDFFPVIDVALSGGENYAQLRAAAKLLEEKLSEIEGVGSIEKWGFYDKAIWVDVDKNKLEKYGLTLLNFINVLRDRDISTPAGNKVINRKEHSIRFISPLDNVQDVEKVIIRSNEAGKNIRVRDVAHVSNGFKDGDIYLRSQGERAILLQVKKHPDNDSIKISQQVRDITKKLQAHFAPGIKVAFADDMSIYLKNRLKVLYSNGAFGAVLVIFMLVLLLRPSVAVVTAIGLPVAFAASFYISKSVGISFNMISIFGYIMVLGMMVDDAIVVGENVYRHMEMGKKPFEAAVVGASEMILPVIASVTTTIAAFLPLMMIGGMIGQFLSAIPKIIIIALSVSLIECFFILPSHLSDFVRPKVHFSSEARQEHWFFVLREHYGRMLNWVLHRRVLFAVLILGLLVVATVLEFKKGIVFTDAQISEIDIDLKTEQDFSVDDTEAVVKKIEKAIFKLPEKDLDAVNAFVGMKRDRHSPPRFAPNIAQIRVLLHIEDERQTKDANVIVQKLRDWIGMPAGVTQLSINVVKGGPATGEDIDIEVSGDSYETIQVIAEELIHKIKNIEVSNSGEKKRDNASIKPVKEINTDLQKGRKEIRLIVDEAKAALAGVNLSQTSTILRAAIAGIKLKSIKRLGEDIDVMVRINADNINSVDDLLNLRIPNRMGNRILLKEIVKVEYGDAYSELKHRNGKVNLSVIGTIDKTQTNVNVVNMKIKHLLKEFKRKYTNVDFVIGGEQKDMMKGFQDLGKAFLIALFLIFIILATLFNSFGQPLIIMLAIPFGFVGVMLTLFIHNMPISFMAFMGFVGLTGVVVNDSLILVSFINKLIKAGKKAETAIIEGAKTRLRPVILTTVTTSAGLLPLAYGWFGGDEPFIRPMALVFAWGLLFATGVTLFIIPSFLAITFNLKILFRRKFKKDYSVDLIFPKLKKTG